MEKGKRPAKKTTKNSNDKKALINNEIIQRQGKFKQAKVSTVRKLVDKLKRPEKYPKQNRAAKAGRYQNVLNQIKQMSPKRLGLLALMYYKSGKNYLTASDSTVEQLAVGYFCEHKSVNGILDEIRNKLKLNEKSNWRKSVKKLFKKKDKTLNAEKVEEKKKTGSFTETDDTDSKATAKSKNKKIQQKSEANGKTEKPEKSQKKQKQPAAQEDAESNKSDDSSESDADFDVKSTKENSVSEPQTTVDEFFITADGSNYLSTAVVNRNQEEDSDGNDNQHFYHGKDFERKPREASFFHKSDKKPVKPAVNRFEGTKRKWSDESEEQIHKPTEKKIDPELHPSWQAKQKLKPTITEFKGKKITFD